MVTRYGKIVLRGSQRVTPLLIPFGYHQESFKKKCELGVFRGCTELVILNWDGHGFNVSVDIDHCLLIIFTKTVSWRYFWVVT
jgi:hypothetical protein